MDFSRRDRRERKPHWREAKSLRLNAGMWLIGIAWTTAIIASLAWNVHQFRANALQQARNELRTTFFKDLTFRRWAAGNGGVYVQVPDTRPDSSASSLSGREVVTSSGRVLTMLTPAEMQRQLYDLSKGNHGTHGHISSLNPINPKNAPDPWEHQALLRLRRGREEISEIAELDGRPHLRLIRPVYLNEDCLKCHEGRGNPGDVGGAISVSVPLEQFLASAEERTFSLAAGHGLLWLLGLFGLMTGGLQLAHRVAERDLVYRALEENERHLATVLSSSLDAIITIDENGYITGWNERAEQIFGWPIEEIIGRRAADTIIPLRFRDAHLTALNDLDREASGGRSGRRVEFPARHRYRGEFPVELSIAAFTSNGKTMFSAFVRDISKRRWAEEQTQRDYHAQRIVASVLEISIKPMRFEEKLEQVLNLILSTPWLSLQSKGAIFTAAPDSPRLLLRASRGISANVREGCGTVGFGECLCGKVAQSGRMIFSSGVDHRHDRIFSDTHPHGHYCLPIRTSERLLGVLTLYLDEGHQCDQDEVRFLSAIANTLGGMIERHETEEKLLHYAYYDQLTGLPNRTLFTDRLHQCVQRSIRRGNSHFALLFLDLDRFKNINDGLGHEAGDELLRAVARRLEKCVRPGDSISRLGGDEFTILLEEVQGVTDALRIAQRIHHELIRPLLLKGQEVFTTASIGIALNRPQSEGPLDLLRDADTAMYRAKTRGPGQIAVFDSEMHTHVSEQLMLEMEVRRAVERQEFLVHYQPIFSSSTQGLVGFEALVRWSHPRRGLIPPAEFVALAEETGAVTDLGRWVLNQALADLSDWRARLSFERSIYVSINLSAKQFLQEDLANEIDEALERFALPAPNLRLELTESVFMENLEAAHQILEQVRDRGVGLYMDDFGTGYSSLSYLRQLPFDALKIDRSFVQLLGTGEKHDALIESIVTIARQFGMDVIGEGVETQEQLKRLEGMGCGYVQGHLLSRPLSADGVVEAFGATAAISSCNA